MLVVAGGSLVYAEASSSLFFLLFLFPIDAEVSLDLAKCASVAVCRYDR